MIKAVFFDAFGTLFDLRDSHPKVIEDILKELGREEIGVKNFHREWDLRFLSITRQISKSDFIPTRDIFKESLRSSLKKYSIEVSEEQIQRFLDKTFEVFKENIQLYDDAYEILNFTKNLHVKLGLISDSDANLLRSLLEKFNLTRLFDAIIISDEVKAMKPNPQIFKQALTKVNCYPKETVVIGDSLQDVKGAQTLGMITVLILRRQRNLGNIKPDYVITDLRDFKNILLKLIKQRQELP